ncbi:MAG TPA: hypothetical protein VLG16_04370 [Candidatus Saccharimonadales bacterium]|nr:hypothetical protein [Candidatus Saccharimonadales bacterium]
MKMRTPEKGFAATSAAVALALGLTACTPHSVEGKASMGTGSPSRPLETTNSLPDGYATSSVTSLASTSAPAPKVDFAPAMHEVTSDVADVMSKPNVVVKPSVSDPAKKVFTVKSGSNTTYVVAAMNTASGTLDAANIGGLDFTFYDANSSNGSENRPAFEILQNAGDSPSLNWIDTNGGTNETLDSDGMLHDPTNYMCQLSPSAANTLVKQVVEAEEAMLHGERPVFPVALWCA